MEKQERLEQEIRYYQDCINLLTSSKKEKLIKQFKEEIRIRKRCIEEFSKKEHKIIEEQEIDFKIEKLKQELQQYNHLVCIDKQNKDYWKAKRIETNKIIQNLLQQKG